MPAAAWSDVPPSEPTWVYRALGPVRGDLAAATRIDTKNKRVQLYLVVPCEDNGLYCLDGAAGVPRWILRTRESFNERPTVAGSRVFARNKRRMVVVSLENGPDGPESWASSQGGGPLKGFEQATVVYAADDMRAYLGSGDRMVMRVDGKSGEPQASARMMHFDKLLPAPAANLLIGLTTDGHILAFR